MYLDIFLCYIIWGCRLFIFIYFPWWSPKLTCSTLVWLFTQQTPRLVWPHICNRDLNICVCWLIHWESNIFHIWHWVQNNYCSGWDICESWLYYFFFKSVSTYVTGTETFVFADLFVGTVTFFTDVTLTKTIVTVVVTFVSSDLSVRIEVFSTDETGTKINVRLELLCVLLLFKLKCFSQM